MDVMRTHIHQGWEFAFAPNGHVQTPADAAPLTYRPALVPGTNLTDLQAAGMVEPDTSATYEDSFAPYESMDFVYRTRFEGGAAAARKHVRLCFDGLDTVCDIWLNGERIGYAENAFLAYEFDVTGKLEAGANTLLLIFRSPIVEAERRYKEMGVVLPPRHLDLKFHAIRKPAYSFFWDWGPQIPVSGMYRPAYVKSFDEAEIKDFHVRYTVAGNHVTGSVTVTALGAGRATALVRVAGQEFSAPLRRGTAVVPFSVSNARLWYPNGEGEPFLYDMDVELVRDNVLDARHHRIGFRTIEVVRNERTDGRGKRFLFRVNGRDIFCRGYNWIPVDNSIPRGYWGLYQGNLDLARAGGTNMLRIWGGGYYEDDEFYRLCDERGIMVWQDGMFACAMYPDTDRHFMTLVKAELEYNIKRLRNFTSLAIWCGENENHWGYDRWWPDHRQWPHFYGTEIYEKLFPALVKKLDPDRFYWNGSPYSEEPGIEANDPFHGDVHIWDLHTNCADFSAYLGTAPSFVSETGLQSLPDLRTTLTIGGPEDRHIQSFVFDTRNHFESPAKNDRLLKFTGAWFRVSADFEKSVVLSNLAHGEYLKYAVEHWRSQAYDCAGVLIWQINDCWPAISWAVVDYNLIPKGCFYYLQRAFAPVIVGFKQRSSIVYDPAVNSRGQLFVASEHDGLQEGVVELDVVRVTGELLDKRRFPVRLTGRGALSLGEIELPDYKTRRFDCLAVFTLRLDNGLTARNIYTFSRPKHMRLPRPTITITQVTADALTVHSNVFAKGLYLFHPDKSVIFEDNYLDLLPGEARTIRASKPIQAADVTTMCYHH